MSVLCRTFNRMLMQNFYSVSKKYVTATKSLAFNITKYKTKVPLKPTTSAKPIETEKTAIDLDTLELLERLSLCNLSDKEALNSLEESIEFASQILHIDTSNVQPLYFVHADDLLNLRKDIANEGNIRDLILKNATATDDTCFIAPPGNIPVELEKKNFAE